MTDQAQPPPAEHAAEGTPAPRPNPAGAPGPYVPVDAPGVGGRYPPVAQPPAPAYPGGPVPVGPRPAGGGYPPVPAPPREAWQAPRRVDAVPGTPFGVMHLDVAPVTSGLAIAALVTGIASILVALVVGCFGLAGAGAGWGGWAAGAFALLAALLGLAAIGLGELGRRQTARPVRPPAIRFTGRKLAIAGLICGGVGFALTVVAFSVAVLLQSAA